MSVVQHCTEFSNPQIKLLMLQAPGLKILAGFHGAKLDAMRYVGKRTVYMASVGLSWAG